MKLTILLIFLLLIAQRTMNSLSLDDAPRPRFEKIYTQYIDGMYLEVFRDREIGQEFICSRPSKWNNDYGVGCFLTGRAWK